MIQIHMFYLQKKIKKCIAIIICKLFEIQRVYCYLPIKFDPSLLLQQIVFVQLPSKRKCKLRIDEYKMVVLNVEDLYLN